MIAHIGRVKEKKFSYEGIRWLTFLEKYTGQEIRHARNGGERVLKPMGNISFPDGYVRTDTQTITQLRDYSEDGNIEFEIEAEKYEKLRRNGKIISIPEQLRD